MRGSASTPRHSLCVISNVAAKSPDFRRAAVCGHVMWNDSSMQHNPGYSFSAHPTKRCTLSQPTKCYILCNEYRSIRVAPVPGTCALPDDTSSTKLPGLMHQGLPRGLRIRTITFVTTKINFAIGSACLTMVNNLCTYPAAPIPFAVSLTADLSGKL